MIKNNKWKLILSSAVILLPVLVGLIFWNELPERMATHWGADGNADGSSVKAFAVFGLPLITLALHLVCVFFTAKDPKNKDQNKKVFGMVLWICPILSFFACGITYADAFGKEFDIIVMTLLLIGLLFIVIGNYLPKCKQNRTIGIKVKWALENEENWNATHRMGGKVWVVGGLLLMACAFLPSNIILWALTVIFLIMLFIPIIYSYAYYRKQLKEGTAAITPIPKSRSQRVITAAALIFVAGILAFVGLISFTGDIEVKYGDTSFTIEASYWGDLTVEYSAIDNIEYREQDDPGIRTGGFGSSRLQMGTFKNDEFGSYTRYSYTGCGSCVVLTTSEKTLVISGIDDESTKAIYEELAARK